MRRSPQKPSPSGRGLGEGETPPFNQPRQPRPPRPQPSFRRRPESRTPVYPELRKGRGRGFPLPPPPSFRRRPESRTPVDPGVCGGWRVDSRESGNDGGGGNDGKDGASPQKPPFRKRGVGGISPRLASRKVVSVRSDLWRDTFPTRVVAWIRPFVKIRRVGNPSNPPLAKGGGGLRPYMPSSRLRLSFPRKRESTLRPRIPAAHTGVLDSGLRRDDGGCRNDDGELQPPPPIDN